MSLDNYWGLEDYILAREAFVMAQGYNAHKVIVRKFRSFETKNADGPKVNQYRVPIYANRQDSVYLGPVKVYDTVKGGYFTTGDIDVNSVFQLFGQSPAQILPDGTKLSENAGDQIIWNGKIWQVSDQIEPIIQGPKAPEIFFRTVMRRVDRSGQGITPGPG